MDGVFDTAKARGVKFIKKWLDGLDKEWNSWKKKDENKADAKGDKKRRGTKEDPKEKYVYLLALLQRTPEEWDKG